MSRSNSPKRRKNRPVHNKREICGASGKRKARYSSRKRALTALNVSRGKNGSTGIHSQTTSGLGPIDIYRCPDCGGWHLTSKEGDRDNGR